MAHFARISALRIHRTYSTAHLRCSEFAQTALMYKNLKINEK
jgi:hypothetical protein